MKNILLRTALIALSSAGADLCLADRLQAQAADELTIYPTPLTRDDGRERQSLVRFEDHALAVVVNEQSSLGVLTDQRGVSEAIISPEGEKLGAWQFEPYGRLEPGSAQTVAGLDSVELVASFTGSVRDSYTGLVHMGAREYAAAIGGFTSPDPLLIDVPALCSASPGDCVPYGYARHDPINYSDPSGTLSKSVSRAARQVNHKIRERTRPRDRFSGTTFRGDTRLPYAKDQNGNEIGIFKTGFSARGQNKDLQDHVDGVKKDSAYVGTSKDRVVGEFYAESSGNKNAGNYVIRAKRGLDISKQGVTNRFQDEKEVVFRNVKPRDIRYFVPTDPKLPVQVNPSYQKSRTLSYVMDVVDYLRGR